MSDRQTFPRISLRVSHELKAACDKAGPERMRQALSVLLSDNAMSDKPVSDTPARVRQPKVKPLSDNSVSDNGMSDKGHGNVSDNTMSDNVVSDTKVSDKPGEVSDNLQPLSDKPKEAPTLAERIAAGRAEVERKKAAKAALIAGLPQSVRGLVS